MMVNSVVQMKAAIWLVVTVLIEVVAENRENWLIQRWLRKKAYNLLLNKNDHHHLSSPSYSW